MAIIAVDKQGLLEDFKSWGVSDYYRDCFIEKNKIIAEKVELSEFAFDDYIRLKDSAQWVSAYAAFWCRFYREAVNDFEQAQALGAIQSLYYIAGMLELNKQISMIHTWWFSTYPLHYMESLNMPFVHGRDISAVH